MSKHVAPERWAELARGEVGAREREAIEQHAATCTACARSRARVERATAVLGSLRAQSSPDLSWDAIRARVHWSVSTERRTKAAKPAPSLAHRVRPWTWAVVASAAAASAAVAAVELWPHGDAPVAMHEPVPAIAPAPAIRAPSSTPAVASAVAPPGSPALAGVVSRLSGDVLFDGVHRDGERAFAEPIAVGARLATGDGRIDVQIGAGTAASLAPHSQLELRRVDAEVVELAVIGTVDVEVAPRAAGQRFLVVAGDRTVEVRGTQFRVRSDGAGTHVACRHGLVAVRDAVATVEVAAAREVDVPATSAVATVAAVTMSNDEMAQLALATPVTTPTWGDPDAALHATSTLEIAAPSRLAVRIDGVERGDAPMRLRVTPGRHLVEAADRAGRYKRVDWVDVGAGAVTNVVPVARVTAAVETNPSAAIAARRHELESGLKSDADHARIENCVRAMTKAGLGDTFVQIEIAVDAAGAVSYLNVVDTDLPSTTASCVRDALATVRFAAGEPASWRERVDL